VNKKKQKNFITWAMGVAAATAHAPKAKSFLRAFFQKSAASS
jgi:hypothetical protein